MEQTFPLTPTEAEAVYHALRYYASELLDSFVEDDDGDTLAEAVVVRDLADRLQVWLVANRQSLDRDSVT